MSRWRYSLSPKNLESALPHRLSPDPLVYSRQFRKKSILAGSFLSESGAITLGSIQSFNAHEWLATEPSVYFLCQGEKKTVLPDVKKKEFLYTFKGEESWQPLTESQIRNASVAVFFRWTKLNLTTYLTSGSFVVMILLMETMCILRIRNSMPHSHVLSANYHHHQEKTEYGSRGTHCFTDFC